MIEDTTNMTDKVFNARLDAERKAWDSLARYKFFMFGYWAGAWVKYNALMPKEEKLPNPFKALVLLARLDEEDKQTITRQL
jgi:hypothetical protein